ncbi:hypothetical protein Z949_3248 [Sulfitobacter guttiformis KCTC 32187]|nr:hypothetical protein Z949_3248 [Sulfitobacter guttiformis KCTC 32187]
MARHPFWRDIPEAEGSRKAYIVSSFCGGSTCAIPDAPPDGLDAIIAGKIAQQYITCENEERRPDTGAAFIIFQCNRRLRGK